MLHPLFSTIIRRPDLLVDHLAGYATLIGAEASESGAELLQRGLAWAVTVMCGAIFVMLTGTAVMLGFVLNQFHWMLVAVPGVTLVLLIVAASKAMKPLTTGRFDEVRAQVTRDAQALRTAA
ncbi:MAG TPA: hypothetical protein VE934_08045 [Polaromonas sp.]|uniref:hypothetical protein n=1 Tax=Polaromonas sp. TaxID=1869339 RepID=UPI002D3C6616|nr:hypothetical protein [Polaromonas sp.]HYW56896.1 hypothetical protein [Polaromonas sp.]